MPTPGSYISVLTHGLQTQSGSGSGTAVLSAGLLLSTDDPYTPTPVTPYPDPGPTDELLQQYFGAIEPPWTADAVADEAASRRVVNVLTTRLYGDPLYGKYRGVKFDQGLLAWVQAPIFSAVTGAPIVLDVSNYVTTPEVDVRIIEASGADPRVYEPDEPAELAADGRSIEFQVPPEVANASGVYRAQFRVVDSSSVERVRDEFWIYVDRGLWTADGGVPYDIGPPTFSEVRTAIRDHPAVNRLLGDFEFDPAEIGWAVVSAVQQFNNELPPLPAQYLLTTRKLPGEWRRQILAGATSFLFDTAATYFRRGHLPYAAGNLTVDDLNKDKEYTNALTAIRQSFLQWIRLTRTSISIQAGWGSVSSGYPFGIR